ncbi:palmitoyltransferase ZDHHC2 isoform X1 [Pantherophis guttatus]|uniref:Palmitoyltransferase n=2 Tax=Pantherophis guttatus TaxID=94885 RepID=A0ABM3Z333_PANGU|nr:palmitoyltransferase ZDHHC2 isoform X1 [Pantherophis guttatus]
MGRGKMASPAGSVASSRSCSRIGGGRRHCLWRRAGPFLYWVPVLFICSILAWSYYAYVAQLCLRVGSTYLYYRFALGACMRASVHAQITYDDVRVSGRRLPPVLLPVLVNRSKPGATHHWFIVTISNIGEKMVCLIAYHLFFMMFLWSYWKTIFTLPMNPSKEFHLSYSDKELLEREPRNETHQEVLKRAAKDLPISTRTMSGAIRYCDRCQLIKPDRCHHCSVCDKCILKMDHHCPWVNNCVGFSNYKFFLLFLAYSLLYCLFIFATELQHFIRFWTNGLPDTQAKFHIMFLFFAAAMFSISLSSLFGYHCWLVSKNKSTLEAFRAPVFRHGTDKNGFNLGFSKNLREVFGDEKKYWLLPIFTSLGDGCSFPTCLVNQDLEQASTPAGHNANKNENSHHFPAKTLRDSQSHLLTDPQSWTQTSADTEKNKLGMSNPALSMENET